MPDPPGNLWIICAGTGSVGIDGTEWLATHAPSGSRLPLINNFQVITGLE